MKLTLFVGGVALFASSLSPEPASALLLPIGLGAIAFVAAVRRFVRA
jgi:hypothetical protein